MVSSGYLGEQPRSDEWFVTGDLGSIDTEVGSACWAGPTP